MPASKVTKSSQKRNDAAIESFQNYYASIWNKDRWHESLYPALSQPTRYCALANRFGSIPEIEKFLTGDLEGQMKEFNLPHGCSEPVENGTTSPLIVQRPTDRSFPQPIHVKSAEASKTVLSHWNMDLASVLAVCVLQVRPGDQVLDLCAAPGGKSIVLSQMLWPDLHADRAHADLEEVNAMQSCLHSNELDQTRHQRLASNLHSYLPSRLFADNAVKVLRIDGSEKSAVSNLPLGPGGYDKVLLDAPCSSERHIIHAHLKATSGGRLSEEMTNWKLSHTTTMAKTQAALLMTAFMAVKVSGSVLYATCSISSEENDGVIDRVLEAIKRERKKRSHSEQYAWRVNFNTHVDADPNAIAMLESLTERTKYGRIALPDHPAAGRWGPLYFCLMQKVPHKIHSGLDKEA